MAAITWTAAAGVAAVYYFTWLLQPGRAGMLVLYVLLVGADFFNLFQAVTFWATSLRKPKQRAFRALPTPAVDVLIPTLNEPWSILGPTVQAAQTMRGASLRVWILDDGNREEIRVLAEEVGALYLARQSSRGAKAGNLNDGVLATAIDGAPFVSVFDSDHMAYPDFLERTLGYFTDASVALVQTPQEYRNAQVGLITRGAAEQQALFFGPVLRGRDGFGASFCCGTNFVVRRDALERAGGFPEDSITEDIVLSAKLVGLGYEIAYVPQTLAEGLGPEDARSYISQQLRWASGCLDLLLRRPKLWRPLSWTQRWQYFAGTSYWLTGWTIIVYLSLPILRLLLGWQPVGNSAGAFAQHFLPYFLLCVLNLGRATMGRYTFVGLAMTWGSFPIHVRGTWRALAGQGRGFVVTPKRAVAGMPWVGLGPNLAFAALLVVASIAGLLLQPGPGTVNNVAFAGIDCVLIGAIVVFAFQQSRRLRSHSDETEQRLGPAAALVGEPEEVRAATD